MVEVLKALLMVGALIWLFYRVFESPRSRFVRKWADHNWTYGKIKLTYQSRSNENRKMRYLTKVRGDLETDNFQIINLKPRCNGTEVGVPWHVVEDEGLKARIREHLEEEGSDNPFDLI